MKKPKLIYTHVGLSSFVVKDIKILEESFQIKIYHFKLSSKSGLPFTFLKQFFWLFFNIWGVKGTVTQFAGYQSYLPTALSNFANKRSILILGGNDSVSFPSIRYGCFYNPKLKRFTRKSLQKASLLLPVSETLIEYDYTYTSDDFPKQGYRFHAPEVDSPVYTIYNGYDTSKWQAGNEKELNSFLTIGADLGSRFGKTLKGIDLILEIAPKFPESKFYIVGGQKLTDQLPSNVIPVANMPHDELPGFIASKQFYLQLSMSEGFPNALCEAMLCGCVPIVSKVGAMPMIVKNAGYILENKDASKLENLVATALSEYDQDKSTNARKRIAENFTLSKRKEELTSIILEHLQS